VKFPMIRLGGTGGDKDCADTEPLPIPAVTTSGHECEALLDENSCREAAKTGGYHFAGVGDAPGCYIEKKKLWGGKVFFGPHGTDEQKQEHIDDLFKMRFGSQDCCFPNDAAACAAAAKYEGFRVGLIFAGEWKEAKGCFGFVDQFKAFKAFFSTGGTEEENRAAIKHPMIRLGGKPCTTTEPSESKEVAMTDVHVDPDYPGDEDSCKKFVETAGFKFMGLGSTPGCYIWKGGKWAGNGYFGPHGDDDDKQAIISDRNKWRFGAQEGSFPKTAEECKEIAKKRHLRGWNWKVFENNGATKGCYAYATGPHQGQAHWGNGGSASDIQTNLQAPMFRVV